MMDWAGGAIAPVFKEKVICPGTLSKYAVPGAPTVKFTGTAIAIPVPRKSTCPV